MISEKLLQDILKKDFLMATWIDKKIFLDMTTHYNCKIFSDINNCIGKDFVLSGIWRFFSFSYTEHFLKNFYENCQG
jgi:hypothetical protein